MAILDSVAAVRRATAQVGLADGAGACLANVYKWFGSVQSIGPGAGHYDWAVKGWNYTPDAEKHAGDYNAPAGVPVYFGAVGGPRWSGDRNYPCGDIGLSIGNGYAIFTDSPTGNTGVMSIRARGAQIGRPYLGWTESFLGHKTSAGNAWKASTGPVVTIPRPGGSKPATIVKTLTSGESMSENIKVNGKYQFTVGMEYVHWHSTQAESDISRKVMSTTDEQHGVTRAEAEQLFRSLGIPVRFLDVATLHAQGWNDTWSRMLEIQGAVKGLSGIKQLPDNVAAAISAAE